jgi:spermidine synthase
MAGEVRDWRDDRQIVERRDYVDSPYFEAKFKVQILESRMTPFCHLEIAWNPLFGNMMFIDGEIQISQVDDAAYHTAMWRAAHKFISVPDLAPRALVIGDGDGGFTRIRTGARSIDVVERDRDIIAAGAKYFGADWDKVLLHAVSLENFEPEHEYDVVMLAIDDGFNGAAEFEADLDRIASWLKPGGKIVAQAGSDLDPKHPMIFERYRNWADSYRFVHARERVYVGCYFCHENFFVVEKK